MMAKILRKSGAFTLVELLVVVVIIGILAAIALPNYVGASQKAKSAAVRGNMRTVQIASESYATDSGGAYCPNTSYQAFLPGGSNSIGGSTGFLPVNPITGQTSTVVDAGLATATAISNQRTQIATSSGSPASPGNLGYCVADTGQSYAVIGADVSGKYVSGAGGTCLILSNR